MRVTVKKKRVHGFAAPSGHAALRVAPSHPGPSIRRSCIGSEAAGCGGALTVRDAAERLGVSRAALSRVLNPRASISPELALRLEAVGWGDAASWTWRQACYDLAQARKRRAATA